MGKLKLSISISTGDKKKKKDGGDNKNIGGYFGREGGERKEGPIDVHYESCTCATKSKESIKPFSGVDKAKCSEGKLKEQTLISGRGVDPPELHERFERIFNRNVENNNNNNNNNGCNINNEGNSNKEEINCKYCCGKQGEKREEDTEKAEEKKDGEKKRNENDRERENRGDTNGQGGGGIPIHDVHHGYRDPPIYGYEYGYRDPPIYGYEYGYRDPPIYGYEYGYRDPPIYGVDKAKCSEGKLKELTVISGRGVDPPELHERFERIFNRNVENNNNNNNNNGCNINNEGNSNKEESNCKCCCGKQGEKREEDTEKAEEKKDGEKKRNENDRERENRGDTNGQGGGIPIHDVHHGDRDSAIYGYGYKYPVDTQSQMFIDEDPNACSVM